MLSINLLTFFKLFLLLSEYNQKVEKAALHDAGTHGLCIKAKKMW